MPTRLSAYLKSAREEQKISREELAKLLKHSSVKKRLEQITELEENGRIRPPDLPTRIAEVLQLDQEMVRQLEREDFEAWQRWLNEPVPMRLIVRAMSAVYVPQQLPPEVTTPEEAEHYARGLAKRIQKRMCLVVSRRLSVWIGWDGEIERRTEAEFGEVNWPTSSFPFVPNIDFTQTPRPIQDED